MVDFSNYFFKTYLIEQNWNIMDANHKIRYQHTTHKKLCLQSLSSSILDCKVFAHTVFNEVIFSNLFLKKIILSVDLLIDAKRYFFAVYYN